jgi:hypothetical protein
MFQFDLVEPRSDYRGIEIGKLPQDLRRIEDVLQSFTPTHHPWGILHTLEWAPTTRHRHGPNPPLSPTSHTELPSQLHTPWTRPSPAWHGPGPARPGPVPARPMPGMAQALHGPAHSHRNLRLRSVAHMVASATHRVHTESQAQYGFTSGCSTLLLTIRCHHTRPRTPWPGRAGQC